MKRCIVHEYDKMIQRRTSLPKTVPMKSKVEKEQEKEAKTASNVESSLKLSFQHDFTIITI